MAPSPQEYGTRMVSVPDSSEPFAHDVRMKPVARVEGVPDSGKTCATSENETGGWKGKEREQTHVAERRSRKGAFFTIAIRH